LRHGEQHAGQAHAEQQHDADHRDRQYVGGEEPFPDVVAHGAVLSRSVVGRAGAQTCWLPPANSMRLIVAQYRTMATTRPNTNTRRNHPLSKRRCMNHSTTSRNLRIVRAISEGMAMLDGTVANEIATSI